MWANMRVLSGLMLIESTSLLHALLHFIERVKAAASLALRHLQEWQLILSRSIDETHANFFLPLTV